MPLHSSSPTIPNIEIPSVEITARHFSRDGSTHHAGVELSELEMHAMEMCLDLGKQALREGNPPIGAVLIDHSREGGRTWGAKTTDKTNPRLLAHAEVRAYEMAHEIVADNLEECTLVTTAQPCNSCAAPYAEGKISKIIYAAPREAIWAVAKIMRPRKINLPELLIDGDTETTTVVGYRAQESLELLKEWGLRYNLKVILDSMN